MEDTFFTQKTCDRCNQDLKIRTMSWFNSDTICLECLYQENLIKQKLPNGGKEYEGCGYIPIIENEEIL